jgi:hypothetical protein
MSKIYDAQDRIVSLLNADPYFNDPIPAKKIVAISQRKGNIANEVQQALQKIGVGVIVMLPLITFDGTANRISLGLRFAVVVTENVIVNQSATGTQKPAEAICEKVLLLLHFKPNSATGNPHARATLFQIDKNAVRIMPPAPGSASLLNYTIAVNTDINLN